MQHERLATALAAKVVVDDHVLDMRMQPAGGAENAQRRRAHNPALRIRAARHDQDAGRIQYLLQVKSIVLCLV